MVGFSIGDKIINLRGLYINFLGLIINNMQISGSSIEDMKAWGYEPGMA